MASNTPKLGLYMKDPVADGNDFFDVKTMMNDNWEKIDGFAGVMDGVKERFDTISRQDVTLNAGMQVITAIKSAPFSLSGVTGRMLVNLLGRMGNCESVGLWSSNTTIAVDTANKTSGTSSFKLTLGSVPATASASFLTTPGKKYVAIADVKNGNTSKVAISINGIAGATGNEVTSASAFAPSVVRFAATDFFHIVTITGTGASGNTFNMDSVRVYEVSDADYAAAASYTPAQAAAKWPYVDSVMPVRNPYAIRYGENLLPSFYEWSAKQGTPTIADEKNVSVTVDNKIVHTISPLVPGQKYTVSVQSGGATGRVTVTDEPESAIVVEAVGAGLLTATFTATGRVANIRLLGTSSTPITMSNPMLNIGSTAKPFKPREDSMLALQTDLYADPLTGANADTVFERDGQCFKSKKWRGVTLDVNLSWGWLDNKIGYKVVLAGGFSDVTAQPQSYLIKYNGAIAPFAGDAGTAADRHNLYQGNVFVSIPMADSGWGDSYTPTADEIKAYFMGWKMKQFGAGDTTPYTSGTKEWVQILNPVIPGGTTTLPVTVAPNYTPYQLVYQLATPTVEPIVSEGQLTFIEGDNQVEVGTGIVIREPSKPVLYQEGAQTTNRWAMNKLTASSPNPFKNLPRKALQVYGNGFSEPFNTGTTGDLTNWYGGVYIDQLYAYGADKSYSVTYLMAATSPVAAFVGSYAVNEKTLLADLVDSVQQNTARVSVLENKKAEKDNPAWIAPTLLNGTTNTSGSEQAIQYVKTSDGQVLVRGVMTVTALNVEAFRLPAGYRPSKGMRFVVSANAAFGQVVIGSDGSVKLSVGSLSVIDLSGIAFQAEQ